MLQQKCLINKLNLYFEWILKISIIKKKPVSFKIVVSGWDLT